MSGELPWNEKIEWFCRGYENAKAEGNRIGLDVFFGFEYGVKNSDFLIYNLDKEWLLTHPDIDKWEPRKAFRAMHEGGGFIIHAHPFREKEYIDHIRLYPRDVDGVEVFNAAQREEPWANERAKIYAMMYNLPMTAGSDSHSTIALGAGGIETGEILGSSADYLKVLKEGKLKLLS